MQFISSKIKITPDDLTCRENNQSPIIRLLTLPDIIFGS